MKLIKFPYHLMPIVKAILPPTIYVRTLGRYERYHLYGGETRQYPKSKGVSIVQEARQHFEQVARFSDRENKPLSKVWTRWTDRLRDAINMFVTPQDVIFYAQQGPVGFDHRAPASSSQSHMKLYADTLRTEFPHFSSLLDELDDSPYSHPETLLKYQGRLVSNISFYHLRPLLQCLTYVREPRIVCEIGGGYGGSARLWLQNSVFRPSCYVDIDVPESLFFAEVFLRVNFDDLKVLSVTNPEKLDADVVSRYSVILCPVEFVDALSSLSFDLVVNVGSLQEMTDEWVDFWMQWLKERDCSWFYSLNLFAQPLDSLGEASNSWSPRLSPEWAVQLQTFNPAFVRQQSPRIWAEILAKKQSPALSVNQQMLLSRYEFTKDRILDGQVLLEALDVVRLHPDEDIIWDLLLRCVNDMRTIPKEARYLAKYLAKHASPAFRARNGEELENICQQLDFMRSDSMRSRD